LQVEMEHNSKPRQSGQMYRLCSSVSAPTFDVTSGHWQSGPRCWRALSGGCG